MHFCTATPQEINVALPRKSHYALGAFTARFLHMIHWEFMVTGKFHFTQSVVKKHLG